MSGVIALMLEANPNLSWRDVQEILVRSARQNAPTERGANGVDKATGVEYQSTWIINQVPLFHDPDAYDPLISNEYQIMNPTLNPLLPTAGLAAGSRVWDSERKPLHTNSTVFDQRSRLYCQPRQGNQPRANWLRSRCRRCGTRGQLSQQWSTKEQHLANELSFTTATNGPFANGLPAAEVINPGGLDLIVPGGLGGTAGFGAYWNEYFVAAPNFGQNFPIRGIPQELTVPSPNDMTLENLEVTLNIAGGTADGARQLADYPRFTQWNAFRVESLLRRPCVCGTPDVHQASAPGLRVNGSNAVSNPADYFDAGSVDNGGNLQFTFSTNRIWGERSDDSLIFDPTTNEPFTTLSGTGGKLYNGVDSGYGDLLSQGWQLHFENYGTTALTVNSIETVCMVVHRGEYQANSGPYRRRREP